MAGTPLYPGIQAAIDIHGIFLSLEFPGSATKAYSSIKQNLELQITNMPSYFFNAPKGP